LAAAAALGGLQALEGWRELVVLGGPDWWWVPPEQESLDKVQQLG
jgi:hypothetical protein